MKEATENTTGAAKKQPTENRSIRTQNNATREKEKGKAKTKHSERNATTKIKQAGHADVTQ